MSFLGNWLTRCLRKASRDEKSFRWAGRLLAFYPVRERLFEYLILNLTHYNILTPRVIEHAIDCYQQPNQIEYHILYDNALRLYLKTWDDKLLNKVFALATIESKPLDAQPCALAELTPYITKLRALSETNLKNKAHQVISLSDDHIADLAAVKGKATVVEIAFCAYILDQDSALNEQIKLELSSFYKAMLNYAIERGYYIYPVFTYKWLTCYDSLVDSDVRFLHHAKKSVKEKSIIFKRGYIPQYYTLNDRGFSGWNEVPFDVQATSTETVQTQHEAFYQDIVSQYVATGMSKYSQAQTQFECGKEHEGKRVIFVALQTTNDVVAQLSYIDTLSLLKSVVSICQNTPDTLVVVKPHPLSMDEKVDQYLEEIKDLPYVMVTKASLHSIIEKASLVCVCNSGVGFEALLQLKTVVTTGGSDYAAVTHVVHNEKELQAIVQNTPKIDEGLIKQFLFYYLNSECINVAQIEDDFAPHIDAILEQTI